MIYLCRHGQTVFNRERRIQGQRESELTGLGRAQAAAMAELLFERIGAEAGQGWRIIASPLGRARETAAIIGARLDLPVSTDARLMEIGLGDWEGLWRDDLFAEDPARARDPEWLFKAPGGESYEAVAARVGGWLADQPADALARLVVVSHGVAGRLLRGAYASLRRDEVVRLETPQDAVFFLHAGRIERLPCKNVPQ